MRASFGLVELAVILLLTLVLTSNIVNGQEDIPTWCGKPYKKGQQDPGLISPPLPPKNTTLILQVKPKIQPYTNETEGAFIVIYNGGAGSKREKWSKNRGSYVLRCVSADTGMEFVNLMLELRKEGDEVDVVFSLDVFERRMNPYIITATLLDSISKEAIATQTVNLSVLPAVNPFGGSITKLLIPEGYIVTDSVEEPVLYPYGYYTSTPWLFEMPFKRVVTMAKADNTMIHPCPPYDPIASMHLLFDAAEAAGVTIMYDMRHTFKNLTSVREQVLEFRSRKSLSVWYTADEPDGFSDSPDVTRAAYEVIKELDPYHPVALVLNCVALPTYYTSSADILLTDPYPVGINATWSTLHETPCNATYGDCGCDGCEGRLMDVATRLRTVKEELAPVDTYKPVWSVLQGFGREAYWSRWPNEKEIRVMVYLALMNEAKGILYWFHPQPTYPEVFGYTGRAAKEVAQVGPEILQGSRLTITMLEGHIEAAAWLLANGLLLFMLVNPDSQAIPRFRLRIETEGFYDWDGSAGSVEVNVYNSIISGRYFPPEEVFRGSAIKSIMLPTKTADETPHHVPRSSLFHPGHSTAVNRLVTKLIKPSELVVSDVETNNIHANNLDRFVLSEILPYILSQFSSTKPNSNGRHGTGHDPDRKESSSRCEAARSLLRALNYSLQIDEAVKQDLQSHASTTADPVVTNGREVRLLCLVSLVSIMKKLDGTKVASIFRPPKNYKSRYQPPSSQDAMQVILSSFLTLLDFTNVPAWQAPTIPEDLALKAQSVLPSFIESISRMVGGASERKNVGDLEVAECLIKNMIKGLTRLASASNASDEQIHLTASALADLIHILPSTIHPQRPPITIKILSHHLVLVKHITLPIIRSAVIRPGSGAHAARVLGSFGNTLTRILDITPALADAEPVCRHVSHLLHLLSRVVLDAAAEYYATTQKRDAENYMCLEPEWATHITRWALESQTHRMVSFFIMPILQSFCSASRKSWAAGLQIITDIYRDMSREESFTPTPVPSANVGILKTLIAVSRCRPTSSDSDSRATELYRLFSIKAMSALPDSNQEILKAFVNLFDDPNPHVRDVAARSAAIFSMNADLMDGRHHKYTTIDTTVCHKDDGTCSRHIPSSRSGERIPEMHINNPFRLLTTAMDELVTGNTRNCVESYRTWARDLTRHMFYDCDIVKTAQYEDDRHLSIRRLATSLEKKLSMPDSPRVVADIAAYVFMGVLEGSQPSHKLGNGLACNELVFRNIALALFILRHDSDVDIRVIVLECLAKCLGMVPWQVVDSADSDESSHSTSEPTSDISTHIPDNDEEVSSLVLLYRIAHGISPFCEDPQPTIRPDKTDGEPQIRKWVTMISEFARERHPFISVVEPKSARIDPSQKVMKHRDGPGTDKTVFHWKTSSKLYEEAIRQAEQQAATNDKSVWWAAENQIRHMTPMDEVTDPTSSLEHKHIIHDTSDAVSDPTSNHEVQVLLPYEQVSVLGNAQRFFDDALKDVSFLARPLPSRPSGQNNGSIGRYDRDPVYQNRAEAPSLLGRRFCSEALDQDNQHHDHHTSSSKDHAPAVLVDALIDHLKTLEDLERVTAEVAQIRQSATRAEVDDAPNATPSVMKNDAIEDGASIGMPSLTREASLVGLNVNNSRRDSSQDWKPVTGLDMSRALENVSAVEVIRNPDDSIKPDLLAITLDNVQVGSEIFNNVSEKLDTELPANGAGVDAEPPLNNDSGPPIMEEASHDVVIEVPVDDSLRLSETLEAHINSSKRTSQMEVNQAKYQDDYMHLDEILHAIPQASPASRVVANFPLVDADAAGTIWSLQRDVALDEIDPVTNIADLVNAAIVGHSSQDVMSAVTSSAIPPFSGEPSRVGDTDRSPLSFEWTGMTEHDDAKKPIIHNPESSILPPRINSPTFDPPSVIQSQSVNRGQPGPLIRTRIKTALDLTLRHLVFSATSDVGVDYLELYGTGIHYGSIARWEGIPAVGEIDTPILGKGVSYKVSEALHPALKEAFKLDSSLLMTICASVDIEGVAGGAENNKFRSSPAEKLETWLSGLVQIHRRLLPISKSLRRLSTSTKRAPTAAQALVLLRDQGEISRIAAARGGNELSRLLNTDVLGQMNGGGGMNSFLDWIKPS
ncbi:hypothetical protein SmJEL517_g05197 [Synchytrium microbalum]|uniref:Rap-GAP domain-containing protein n=1 Tax=Synchytrium microbalum TaxID=1806994 RepID=A0A507C0B2_9FUNG|nr:uncharacterized protein SmJEL517_g05197 [Synchytrium microbalum]TPX31494.1 hypothetical protein SmJEL517_g05197 [Synchytrium microbalum]